MYIDYFDPCQFSSKNSFEKKTCEIIWFEYTKHSCSNENSKIPQKCQQKFLILNQQQEKKTHFFLTSRVNAMVILSTIQ